MSDEITSQATRGAALFERLRERHTEFVYRGFEYRETDSSAEVTYHFELPGLAGFAPAWSFDVTRPAPGRPDALLFALGLAEAVSYWKAACPPVVRLANSSLPAGAEGFWQKLFRKGLGEFFYTNDITPPENLVEFRSTGSASVPLGQAGAVDKGKTLIPVGGGKDSAVTLELLAGKTERYCYMLNPRRAMTATAEAAGLGGKTIVARRRLDPALLRLNEQGYLNGHTPFSAVVAFSSLLAAYLNGFGYAALSNEQSAEEPTVPGTDINHQYSKSYEFERDFRRYEAEYIGSGVEYFSLLRPLTEIQIARLFARYPQYHAVFRSCNAGSKRGEWCGACPKCLFVYVILSPFLPKSALLAVFGSDLLAKPELAETLRKLTGELPEKPFECVGRTDEVRAALAMAAGAPAPAMLSEFCERHFIPERLLPAVREALR
jgi:hypothetical protein